MKTGTLIENLPFIHFFTFGVRSTKWHYISDMYIIIIITFFVIGLIIFQSFLKTINLTIAMYTFFLLFGNTTLFLIEKSILEKSKIYNK